MPNKQGMQPVLDAFKEYLKSIESFQSGKKQGFPDSLDKLEEQISKGKLKETSTLDPEHESENFSYLIESIKSVEFEQDVIPYTTLTKLIYKETRYNRELYDTLEHTMKKDWDRYKSKDEDIPSEATRIFLKIKEHVGLSIVQRNHINDRLNDQLKETFERLNETQDNLKLLSEELETVAEEAHEKADKLVIQFISILGIFAAIMMGTIGAFQGFTSIFSNAESIPIGKTLIISAAGASGVSLILFLLLHAISKLTSFSLSNCDCNTRRNSVFNSIRESIQISLFGGNSNKCTCSLFNKYPTIFIVNYLFYYVAITGFIFMYFNFMGYFNMRVIIHISVVVAVYFVATVTLILLHRYLIDKDSNISLAEKVTKDIKKIREQVKKTDEEKENKEESKEEEKEKNKNKEKGT